MKKFFLLLLIVISLFSWTISNSYWWGTLEDPTFMIDSFKLWIWWNAIDRGMNSIATVDNALGLTIEKLMIVFWTLSLFIMTIGWWYMIFAHGQDELLNKWKSIFTAWIISITVALSSWIIMKIVIYLLYTY